MNRIIEIIGEWASEGSGKDAIISVVGSQQKKIQYGHLYDDICNAARSLRAFLERVRLTNVNIGISGDSKYNMVFCELVILATDLSFAILDKKDENAFKLMVKNTASAVVLDCSTQSGSVLCLNDSHIMIPFDMLLRPLSEWKFMNGHALTESSCMSLTSYNGRGIGTAGYILTTSGSTKAPKMVMQSEEGIFFQIAHYSKDLGIGQKDCILNLASLFHDQSIVDIYAALLDGATLILGEYNLINPDATVKIIASYGVTVFSSLPSVFSIIARCENKIDISLGTLRVVTVGGEAVSKSCANDFLLFFSTYHLPLSCRFINGYGATECSWISFFDQTTAGKDNKKGLNFLPIGTITNGIHYHIALCDEAGNSYQADLERTEAIGELWITGDGISPGYFLPPKEITGPDAKHRKLDERDPFTQYDGKRYYKTGDLVYLDTEGCLNFVDRISDEKFQGSRINLSEIENCLRDLDFVQDCAVIIIRSRHNEEALIAVIESNEPIDNKIADLAGAVENRSKFCPKYYFGQTSLPHLNSGKIDKNSLKKSYEKEIDNLINAKQHNESNVSFIVNLKQLWCTSLGSNMLIHIEHASNDQDISRTFAFLGGDSLSAFYFRNQMIEAYETHFPSLPCPETLQAADILSLSFNDLEAAIKSTEHSASIWRNLCSRLKPPYAPSLSGWGRAQESHESGQKSTQYTLSVLDSELRPLSEYYAQKYAITIRVCETDREFIQAIETCISQNNQNISKNRSQIGSIFSCKNAWFSNDAMHTWKHHFPVIFDHNLRRSSPFFAVNSYSPKRLYL